MESISALLLIENDIHIWCTHLSNSTAHEVHGSSLSTSLHCPFGSLTVQTLQPVSSQPLHGCHKQQDGGHSYHPASTSHVEHHQHSGMAIHWLQANTTYLYHCIPVTPILGDQLPDNVSKPISCCNKDTCPAILREYKLQVQHNGTSNVIWILYVQNGIFHRLRGYCFVFRSIYIHAATVMQCDLAMEMMLAGASNVTKRN